MFLQSELEMKVIRLCFANNMQICQGQHNSADQTQLAESLTQPRYLCDCVCVFVWVVL